jgi:hypothetical protein
VYELRQDPDGAWHAHSDEDGADVTNVAGWDVIARLVEQGGMRWQTPNDLSRFRSQFGEPPADLDTTQMQIGEASPATPPS